MNSALSEKEHEEIVKELTEKYVGKTYAYTDNSEAFTIKRVLVDYGRDRQYMNRLEDDFGRIWFILEIEDATCLKEVV